MGAPATASEILFTTDVRGAISQLDAAAGTFSILGQTVEVNAETILGEGLPPRMSPSFLGLLGADQRLPRCKRLAAHRLPHRYVRHERAAGARLGGGAGYIRAHVHHQWIHGRLQRRRGNGHARFGKQGDRQGTFAGQQWRHGSPVKSRSNRASTTAGGTPANANRHIEGLITRYAREHRFLGR